MNRPENQVCSDCPERQPRWASLIVPPPGSAPGSTAIGAFCCLECSGSHRRLGVHISFVRSITLDQWKEHEVLAMENGGNQKVNAIFEAGLDPHSNTKPTTHASGSVRERFIRDKYERRKYFDASILQKYNAGELSSESSSEEDSSDSEDDQPSQRKIAPVTVRAPSEAARIRAENRRNRLGASGKVTPSTGQINKPTIAAIKPRQANRPPSVKTTVTRQPEVDLLDFGNLTTDSGPPPNPPSAAPSPTLDLFRDVKTVDQGNSSVSTATTVSSSPSNTNPPPPSQTESKRMNTDDILAMFHTPAPAPTMNFGNGGAAAPMGVNNGMNNGNMMQMQPNMMQMQPNMMTNNTMAQMNNGNMNNMMTMNSATMMNNNVNMMQMQMSQSNMFVQQQSQQQNNMMGMNGNGNAMGMTNSQNNNMGMKQANQMDNNEMMQMQAPMGGTPNNLNMMGGTATGVSVGGGMMNTSQQTQQVTSQNSGQANPQIEQFAEFGAFQ